MLTPPDDSHVIAYASCHAEAAADDGAADAWLAALPDSAALVASAPLPLEPYGAAVLPASQYIFEQELLGFEAQLRSLTQLLARFGRTLRLAPLPEMFATPRSLAALRAAAPVGAAAAPPVLHLRLGPVRCARIIKGARNIAVLADDVVQPPVDTAAHPLGTDRHLPPAFERVLAASGPRRAGPVRRSGVRPGPPLPLHALPEAFAHADLDMPARGGWLPAPPADWQLLSALRVRSLAEFDVEDWHRPAAACEALSAPDWRRALALARGQLAAGDASRFVLLPWNLSNPASIVPDLVAKLLHWHSGNDPGFRLVLYPFNATPTTRGAIADLAARAAAVPGSGAARRCVFVARLQSVRPAASLRGLFPLAWIEADDPESDWTARRLAHLGLRLAALGPAEFASDCGVATDETIKIDCLDHFGARTYAARTLSARQLGVLLSRSHQLIAGPPPVVKRRGARAPVH